MEEIHVASIGAEHTPYMDRYLLAQHYAVWLAIDELAAQVGLTPSGLAVHCGFEASSFNKSRRFTAMGNPRFPNASTIIDVLFATNTSWAEFGIYVDQMARLYVPPSEVADNQNKKKSPATGRSQ